MFVYVQALDYCRLLKIEVEPNELVSSLKSKIDQELGGNVPEEVIDSLSYLGHTLDCSTPLSGYNIRDSSLLYMGRKDNQSQYQTLPPQAQPMQHPHQYPHPHAHAHQYQQPISTSHYQVRW